MTEVVARINRAADLLLNQGEAQEDGEAKDDGVAVQDDPGAQAIVHDDGVDQAAEEALEGARIVNIVEVMEEPEEEAEVMEEPEEEAEIPPEIPPAAVSNEAHSMDSPRSEYARRMVPSEPVSVQTTNVGDGKKVKTIIYRRRSNSLD